MGNMPGMSMGPMSMQQMMQMHERMMSDPVIRERMMTDPVLQRMLREMANMMQPMQPGQPMPMGADGMGMADTADQEQAVDFIVRLLSDPAVAARVQTDPDLRRLWSDPRVQARLRVLRQTQPQQPGVPPSQHQH